MIPINDNSRRVSSFQIVTVCLLVLNVGVFLCELSLGAGVDRFISLYGAVPREILTGRDIPPTGPHPLYLQLLTSLFIHAGWLHLIGNMIYLCIFGDDIEEALGHGRYLLFYLAMGLIASLTQIVLSGPADTFPIIGASGAVAGVLGAYLIYFPRRRIQVVIPILFFFTVEVSALLLLGLWFLLQLLNGLAAFQVGASQVGGVAVWAHIGGFIAGALTASVMQGRTGRSRPAPAFGYRGRQPRVR